MQRPATCPLDCCPIAQVSPVPPGMMRMLHTTYRYRSPKGIHGFEPRSAWREVMLDCRGSASVLRAHRQIVPYVHARRRTRGSVSN